jgi:tetratricopeptide (TPR) repeat protein
VADGSKHERERLEAAVRADPGAVGFPALAELYRRAARLADAERVVRSGLECRPESREGRVLLGLVLLDQGRIDEARAAFEPLALEALDAARLDPDVEPRVDASGGPSDAELERAFEAAEPDADALIDPDRVAEEAVEWVEGASADPASPHQLSGAIGAGGTFATHTMAALLERQGDPAGADQIRAALSGSDGQVGAASENENLDTARREHVIRVLESWLGNLRGVAR